MRAFPPGRLFLFAAATRLRWQAALIFLVVSAAYFLARTPALDEWDSVQFAQGVGDFNLWQHHPHPPGYPLFILAGWVFSHALGLGVPTALQLAAALGGGLFVACWYALGVRAFGRAVGAWGAAAVGTLLITVMTATKVLTDAPATGLLALTLLLACNGRIVPAALAGAAAVGVRPQLFPVGLLVVGLGVAGGEQPRRWGAGLGVFFGGCLLWLLPTMWLQAHTPDAGGDFFAYPAQLLAQWRWRLDRPGVYIGADTHGEAFLAYRVERHILGWFTRGLGFAVESVWGWAGIAVVAAGWVFYGLCWRRGMFTDGGRRFWKRHLTWALLYVGIVFCCLPGDQRYYLPIFPLLLVPAVAGWATFFGETRGRWLAAVVPIATALATLPFVAENHREAAPPVRMLRYLQARYPQAERGSVCLVLGESFRHAQWYAPEFRLVYAEDRAAVIPLLGAGAPAVMYTDDPRLLLIADLPGNWQKVEVFQRSPLIYRKHHEVTLYRWVRGMEGT